MPIRSVLPLRYQDTLPGMQFTFNIGRCPVRVKCSEDSSSLPILFTEAIIIIAMKDIIIYSILLITIALIAYYIYKD